MSQISKKLQVAFQRIENAEIELIKSITEFQIAKRKARELLE